MPLWGWHWARSDKEVSPIRQAMQPVTAGIFRCHKLNQKFQRNKELCHRLAVFCSSQQYLEDWHSLRIFEDMEFSNLYFLLPSEFIDSRPPSLASLQRMKHCLSSPLYTGGGHGSQLSSYDLIDSQGFDFEAEWVTLSLEAYQVPISHLAPEWLAKSGEQTSAHRRLSLLWALQFWRTSWE